MPQTNHPNSESQSPKEVDLIEVIRLICNGSVKLLAKVWSALVSCIIYLIRKSLWLALFVVIGGLIAIIPSLNAPRYYASSAIVSSNNTESSIIVNQLANIDKLLGARNYAAVAAVLNISETDAAQLKSLVGYYGVVTRKNGAGSLPVHYVAKYDWQDTSLSISRNFLKINASVYSEDIYPVLTDALLGYIGSGAFGQQSNLLRAEQIKKLLVNVDKDIDAMQQAMASYNGENHGIIFPAAGESQKSELTQMQEALSKLYAQKSELERQSALFTTSATFVDGFSKTYTPANRIRHYVAAAVIISFILGVIGLVTWDNRKKIVAAICDKK